MTQRKLIAIGFGLLLLASQAVAQTKKEAVPARTDEVGTVLRALYAAWGDLDPAKTARFYAKDADLAFFDVAPMKYTGWAAYAAGVPQAFAPYKSGKFTLNDDLRTHRQGHLAWATATWHAELTKKDGSKESLEGRYTAVVEKRGDKWLVIHEHMSLPAPPQ